MGKLKLKVQNIDELEEALNDLSSTKIKEIPLNFLLKVADFLGASYSFPKGSIAQFHHPILIGQPLITEGYFTVHYIHGGKDDKNVLKRDFVKYLLPDFLKIIELTRIKRSEKNEASEGSQTLP